MYNDNAPVYGERNAVAVTRNGPVPRRLALVERAYRTDYTNSGAAFAEIAPAVHRTLAEAVCHGLVRSGRRTGDHGRTGGAGVVPRRRDSDQGCTRPQNVVVDAGGAAPNADSDAGVGAHPHCRDSRRSKSEARN